MHTVHNKQTTGSVDNATIILGLQVIQQTVFTMCQMLHLYLTATVTAQNVYTKRS